MSSRWFVLLLASILAPVLVACWTETTPAQPPPQEASTGKTSAAKEAFAENAPLKDVKFDPATYNAKQQRLREHHLVVPIGPLPEDRQKEAAPLPPPATGRPRAAGEAGLAVSIVQNRALTDLETNDATSTVGEPSLAVRGQEILLTGNWYASFSRDGGATFQYRNPETTFPTIPGRRFCCDQVAYYVPSHDLMVWFLQHVKDATGNTVRLAVAQGDDIRQERWRYYDFTPQGVGNWSQEWFDYPDVAASAGSLFVTTNCFNMSDRFTRSVVLRFSLDELSRYAALNYQHFNRTDVGSLRLVQGASNVMYIGTHANVGTLRVFAWADGSGSYQNKDFRVDAWVAGGATGPGPDGNDWLGFVDGRVTAGWATGANQGFAWTSAQGGSFPRAHVRAAVIDWNAGTVVRQPHIWNGELAFAYPAVAPNSSGQVGVSLAYGGGALHPSHAVGVQQSDGSWSLAATANGTHGPVTNRWGDYLTMRTNGRLGSRFACTGFSLSGGPNRQDVVVRLVQFDAVSTGPAAPLPAGPGVASGLPPVAALPVAGPLPAAVRNVLAKETGRKFSKVPLRSKAADMLLSRAPGLIAPGGTRRTTLPLVPQADLQDYLKLAQLPAASSFFYERPETVCLPDERLQAEATADEPWNINCQLVITFQDGTQASGTGWFLGPRVVVTAGHCVHEGEGGNFFKSVEVIPGMNGAVRPFGSQHSTNLRASDGWRNNGTTAADYGAILLAQEFKTPAGKSPGRLPALVATDGDLVSRQLTISGYPADKAFGTQWYDTDPVETATATRLFYSIDTFGGHSGSPVTAQLGGQVVALGIHNYGGCPNRCTRITAAVKADLDTWLAESTKP